MSERTLYHGGVRRLHRGGVILPPSSTGAPSTADYGADAVCRQDRVYLTDELDMARMFAILAPPNGKGDVYEVEPLGELERDPDYSGEGESWAVPMARVVRVVQRNVTELFGLDAVTVWKVMASDGDLSDLRSPA